MNFVETQLAFDFEAPKYPCVVCDRFWSKVQMDGVDDCWVWCAGRNGDRKYGRFRIGTKSVRADWIGYEIACGPIPEGRHVVHHCGNLLCVNPLHMGLRRAGMPARFWAKASIRSGDGCWEWKGKGSGNGYGGFYAHGKHRLAHRVAWELRNGVIPDGMHVLHHCDNRRCVNPAHLFLGTHNDNMADMCAKGRQAKGDRNG